MTLSGCSNSETSGASGGQTSVSSSAAGGGSVSSSGRTDLAGSTAPGGTTASGGLGGSSGLLTASGGTSSSHSGGVPDSGGRTASGGAFGGGGSTRIGTTGTGGVVNSGGLISTGGAGGSRTTSTADHGGSTAATGAAGAKGGTTSAGGTATGGTTNAGGTAAGGTTSGGSTATGGTATGGTTGGGGTATGGTTSAGGNTTNACPPATALTGGKQYCSNTKGDLNSGYSYELWAEGSGTGCMTVHGVEAAFSATWNSVEDFLARAGLTFDRTKTPAQIGTISSEFAETKTADSGLVYVGIYGWTVDPLVEYYILDDWGSTRPGNTASDGTPRTSMGTIVVDGDTYEVWTHERVNKPAITGDNKTFQQYFSIRQTARQCGRISISEHFSQWTQKGMPLGKLVEAKLLMEAQNGSGTIAFSKASVVVIK